MGQSAWLNTSCAYPTDSMPQCQRKGMHALCKSMILCGFIFPCPSKRARVVRARNAFRNFSLQRKLRFYVH